MIAGGWFPFFLVTSVGGVNAQVSEAGRVDRLLEEIIVKVTKREKTLIEPIISYRSQRLALKALRTTRVSLMAAVQVLCPAILSIILGFG